MVYSCFNHSSVFGVRDEVGRFFFSVFHVGSSGDENSTPWESPLQAESEGEEGANI